MSRLRAQFNRPRNWRGSVCALLLLLGRTVDHAGLLAADELECQVGYGGVFQVGRWTPIHVRPPTSEQVRTMQVTLLDVDGRPVAFDLVPQPEGTFSGQFQSGRLDAPLRLSWQTAAGQSGEHQLTVGGDSRLECVRQTTRLWMTVGTVTGFELAAGLLNAATPDTGRGPPVKLLPTASADLPGTADALDSLHLLVLRETALSAEQSSAVRDWVQRGGRLVVLVGSTAGQARSSPLQEWLPVNVGPSYTERQTAGLTSSVTAFVPGKGILRSLDPLTVARLELPSGLVLIDGPTAPVAVRSAHGLGTVTVVGLDLNSAPFLNTTGAAGTSTVVPWGGLPLMCLQLAGADLPTATAGGVGERQLQLAPTGVSDIASQLGGILDHFPSVERASNWNVIGLLGLYLLLVGPIDYLLVHRLLRLPQLTWITLPLWVLLASWWATRLAVADNGTTLETRQIDLLDVAADTGVQRTLSWFSLYSPETRRHDIEWHPRDIAASAATDTRLAGFARPEEGFRGLYRRGGINLGGAGYELHAGSETATALRSPVDQWSSLAFAGDTFAVPAIKAAPLATCRQVIDSDGSLRRFEITHNLPGELTDWFVVQRLEVTFPMPGGSAPARLAPGISYNLTRGCGLKLLKAYIQGELTTTVKRKTGEDVYVRSGEYDPLGLDPHALFRALSFYAAIGGGEYTHLTNQSFDRLDFSPYVHLDRVIVFGRLSQPVSSYTVDGRIAEPREISTFVRLLVPIERESTSPPSVPDAAAERPISESPAS